MKALHSLSPAEAGRDLIHCTFLQVGVAIAFIASWFPVCRLTAAMDCRLQAASCFVEQEP